jgi:hypothetical protein
MERFPLRRLREVEVNKVMEHSTVVSSDKIRPAVGTPVCYFLNTAMIDCEFQDSDIKNAPRNGKESITLTANVTSRRYPLQRSYKE